MPRFFVNADQIENGVVTLLGDDAHHLSRSLRMAVGEAVTVCNGEGLDYHCRLTAFLPDRVLAEIVEQAPTETEPPYRATVWQGLPKGDKLDSIIQKAVECGASEIGLFESERCIVRIKDGERDKKTERRSRIAQEAAKQSGRGCIPRVLPPCSFEKAVDLACQADLPLFCYEEERAGSLREAVEGFANERDWQSQAARPTISIMVGSEGGFSPSEAAYAKQKGMISVGLGKRILRTETAAAFALGCLVYGLELTPKK